MLLAFFTQIILASHKAKQRREDLLQNHGRGSKEKEGKDYNEAPEGQLWRGGDYHRAKVAYGDYTHWRGCCHTITNHRMKVGSSKLMKVKTHYFIFKTKGIILKNA